jgi:hypothetical protein
MKLLQVGDTNAFDTLFAFNTFAEISHTEEMQLIFDNREGLFPKSLRSFFGYALNQVKMYSVKGDRLQEVIKLKESILSFDIELKIKDIQEHIEVTKHITFNRDDTTEYLKVLDKRFITNVKLSEFIKKLDEIIQKYGTRAKASMENNLVDWKSMYHAFRVLLECQELMEFKHITFPLVEKDFLLRLRNQEVEPQEAFVMLEELYDRVSLFENSTENLLKEVQQKDTKELLWKFYGLVVQ